MDAEERELIEAVDAFAEAMKAKLIRKKRDGWRGWGDTDFLFDGDWLKKTTKHFASPDDLKLLCRAATRKLTLRISCCSGGATETLRSGRCPANHLMLRGDRTMRTLTIHSLLALAILWLLGVAAVLSVPGVILYGLSCALDRRRQRWELRGTGGSERETVADER